MQNFLAHLFQTHFMPHRMCLLDNTVLIWLTVAADFLIAVSYFIIPFILLKLWRKLYIPKPAWVRISLLAWCAVFIFFCGMTHLMDIFVMWEPYYWTLLGIKTLTAVVSVITAAMIVASTPKIPPNIKAMLVESKELSIKANEIAIRLNIKLV